MFCQAFSVLLAFIEFLMEWKPILGCIIFCFTIEAILEALPFSKVLSVFWIYNGNVMLVWVINKELLLF